LCYQCNDCSLRCPRGADPSELLSTIRKMTIRQSAVPRFLGRWVDRPHCVPLLLGIPAALLTGALVVRDPIADALGLTRLEEDVIVFAFSSYFPHWLLNSFFGLFTLLMLLGVVFGVKRFWNSLKAGAAPERLAAPRSDIFPSLCKVFKNVITHEKFDECSRARSRLLTHALVFFGFIALSLVAVWVLTARYNPLIRSDFVYPFAFLDPWKILANVGGLSVVAGCLLMIRDRLRDREHFGGGTYFDYALILSLLIVVLTGFATELLHYLRLEPHRHVVYFVHLVFVFSLLMYLPYSKFAHMIYRTAALVFVERYGRGDVQEGQGDVRNTASDE
jgi:quinone-modifying oxidoreductase subunit QmoC